MTYSALAKERLPPGCHKGCAPKLNFFWTFTHRYPGCPDFLSWIFCHCDFLSFITFCHWPLCHLYKMSLNLLSYFSLSLRKIATNPLSEIILRTHFRSFSYFSIIFVFFDAIYFISFLFSQHIDSSEKTL